MNEEIISEIRIGKRQLRKIVNDNEKCAEAVDLVYVTDQEAGISRIRKGDGFIYKLLEKRIEDAEVLSRIKRLVIPPSWEEVWICTVPNGHLQATGFDLKNRKQYRYHAHWNLLRNHTKFYQLHDFGRALPQMREQIQKDMALSGLPLKKVLATIVYLMQCSKQKKLLKNIKRYRRR